MKNRQQVIRTLEKALHLPLSKQQRAIVDYDCKTGSLVDSCAGSGKTTLSLFMILVALVSGQVQQKNVLDITFSKRAQLDMVHKYQDDVHKLNQAGIFLSSNMLPTFRTFDAMFLHLLRHFPDFRHAKVLPSYTKISYYLYSAFKVRPKTTSAKDELRSIFEFRSFLIQNHLTRNGYNLLNYPDTPIDLGELADSFGISFPSDFFVNYFTVARRYEQVKRQKGLIDFNDMKFKLMKKISRPEDEQIIRGMMQQYNLCFIDEFQDIDPLDWTLVRKVLSKDALKHLTVIGDDDQSIYAFRGSDPRIILNYKKNFPKTKIFNLSTNYRTNGNVLDTVRPLIENNKFRMPKHLYSSHRVRGGSYEFCSNKTKSGGNLLLSKVWQMHLSKQIPDQDIAILVRYNSDKALATDWFANHRLYLDSDYTLQDSYVYKIIVGLMTALEYDNVSMLKPYLHVLGFRKYTRHFLHYLQLSPMPVASISSYLKSLYKDECKHNEQHRHASKIDKKILDAVTFYHKVMILPAHAAFIEAKALVKPYFDYMSHENSFMSDTVISAYTNYLDWETRKFKSLDDFLIFEQHKRNDIKYHTKAQQAAFPILTIHQAKGLQFKYVFLYNLTDRDVDLRMEKENQYFSPDLSKLQFIHKIFHMTYAQTNDADAHNKDINSNNDASPCTDLKTSLAETASSIRHYAKHHDKKHARSLTRKLLNDRFCALANNTFNQTKGQQEKQQFFNTTYATVINNSMNVEEERRLIYVGFTRAKNSAVFNVGEHSNPLLSELKIPTSNIMAADKYGRACPVTRAAREEKIASLKKKMAHIAKEKQALLASLHHDDDK